MTRTRRAIPTLLAVIALLLSPCGVGAQQGATITINVTSAETREPLVGAQAVIGEAGRGVIADAAGVIRLTGLAAGEHRIEIRMLGYESRAFTINATAGERMVSEASLSLAPIALEGIEATATPAPMRSGALAATGFYERMERGGGGTFLTREDIERRRATLTSDLFRRVPGVRVVRHDGNYNTSYALEMARGAKSIRQGGNCPVVYFIDGVQRTLSMK